MLPGKREAGSDGKVAAATAEGQPGGNPSKTMNRRAAGHAVFPSLTSDSIDSPCPENPRPKGGIFLNQKRLHSNSG